MANNIRGIGVDLKVGGGRVNKLLKMTGKGGGGAFEVDRKRFSVHKFVPLNLLIYCRFSTFIIKKFVLF